MKISQSSNVAAQQVFDVLRLPIYDAVPFIPGPGYIYYNKYDQLYYVSNASGWAAVTTSGSATLPPAIQSIANLTTVGDEMLYTVGANTYATSPIFAAGRAFLQQTSVANQQSTLNLVPGTNIQAQNSLLQSIANQSGVVSADSLFYTTTSTTVQPTAISAFGRTLIDDIDAATARNTLNVPQKSTPTTDTAVAVWSGITGNALLNTGVTIDASNNMNVPGNVTVTGNIDNITPAERTQLANINGTTISTTQWGYLGAMNQGVATTNTPTFTGASMSNQKITNVLHQPLHRTRPTNPTSTAWPLCPRHL